MTSITSTEGREHVIYGDTDSVYVTLAKMAEREGIALDKESAVEIADLLGDAITKMVPDRVHKLFHSSKEPLSILVAGREVVSTRSMFLPEKKKRYAVYYFKDGDKDVAKIKAMGIEVKRSDTPKFIQDRLKHMIEMLLRDGASVQDLNQEYLRVYDELMSMDAWRLGTPCQVRNIQKSVMSQHEIEETGDLVRQTTDIFHIIKAALATNEMIDVNNDHATPKIIDGDKIEVLELLEYPHKVARKVDWPYIPEWFKTLPYDRASMIHKIWTRKVNNIFSGVLNFTFQPPETQLAGEDDGDW
ncbi:MAG: hypothetical protein D6698_05025 [Gammaproteobacteria bacterium]|nr:MAG: hypothetical protein D6698_05025 [Gammaproteobacteria bacterium]